MLLTFEKFNPDTDTKEYLELIDDNLRVVRGAFVHSLRELEKKSFYKNF